MKTFRCCTPRAIILSIAITLCAFAPDTSAGDLYTGFRGSKSRGFTPAYWSRVADTMSALIASPSTKKAAVWIVTFYGDNGNIYATFPSDGAPLAHVSFTSTDYNEAYLSEFDKRGMRVWLQVEPGAANMDALIDRVLARYGHHPCVAGFGVDVEWLDTQINSAGRPVTDLEAEAWEKKARSYDTTYTLFLKHYTKSRMPAVYRGAIMFVDDSQQFSGYTSCINEFKAWGQAFAPASVGFQFGYPDDRVWWSKLSNPPATIGNGLKDVIPNTKALFWVDFTITEVFPSAALPVADHDAEPHVPSAIGLAQNYPNPFNPSTVISYRLPKQSMVNVSIFSVLGQHVATLVQEVEDAGYHDVSWNAAGMASGMYFYRIAAGDVNVTKRMILQK